MGGKWQEPSAFESGYRGECCDCYAITAAYDTEAEAIEAWNTRYPADLEAVPVTEENMKRHGWVRERTCKMYRVKMFPEYEDCAFECWECSACKRTNDEQRPRYCPNCGAKVVTE